MVLFGGLRGPIKFLNCHNSLGTKLRMFYFPFPLQVWLAAVLRPPPNPHKNFSTDLHVSQDWPLGAQNPLRSADALKILIPGWSSTFNRISWENIRKATIIWLVIGLGKLFCWRTTNEHFRHFAIGLLSACVCFHVLRMSLSLPFLFAVLLTDDKWTFQAFVQSDDKWFLIYIKYWWLLLAAFFLLVNLFGWKTREMCLFKSLLKKG